MESELQGRLRNTFLPTSKSMIPLYEAVANSIQGIEELAEYTGANISDYTITIKIVRDHALDIFKSRRGENKINAFWIEDNGVGFNASNWESFNKLDTLYKSKKGCHGIGRLMWLKAFDRVDVESVFTGADGGTKRRTFSFTPVRGVETQNSEVLIREPRRTIVKLQGFKARYAAAAPKTLSVIASGVLEHCLWYFIRTEGVPTIRIVDDMDSVSLDDLFDEHMHTSAVAEDIQIKTQLFSVTHVKFRSNLNRANVLNLCASGRIVDSETLQGKIPGMTSVMSDVNGDFSYSAYLTSSYLDDRVHELRLGFHISEMPTLLFEDEEVGLNEIREAVAVRVKEFLAESLAQNITASAARIDYFVSNVAPRYRSILRHVEQGDLIVDPDISDRDLDMLLHRQLYKVEQKILNNGHEIIVPLKDETEQEYKQRLSTYLDFVSDIKKSDLANYVLHRKTIIDLLDKAIYADDSGKFVREDVIHELIVPMRVTSTDYEFRRENLWLIDERLAFHNYLSSDKPLSSIDFTSDESNKEPDIASIKIYNNPILVSEKGVPGASITVVEIKRPMRKGFRPAEDEQHDPILQSLKYLQRLRKGAVARGGRPIANANNIPGFIYVIADLTATMEECCDFHRLKKTADGLGYFGYHDNAAYNAYIQVMSFDGLIQGAKERSRAFFDTLGLPAK